MFTLLTKFFLQQKTHMMVESTSTILIEYLVFKKLQVRTLKHIYNLDMHYFIETLHLQISNATARCGAKEYRINHEIYQITGYTTR